MRTDGSIRLPIKRSFHELCVITWLLILSDSHTFIELLVKGYKYLLLCGSRFEQLAAYMNEDATVVFPLSNGIKNRKVPVLF